MPKNKGSIFALALLGAFAVGGTSMIALQSHAQVAIPTAAPVAIGQSPQAAEPTSKADTDNINDQRGDQSGPDKPDAVSGGKQSDVQEHDSAVDPNEVEDAN